VPSVLIETGYMSNEEDSKFLFSPEGQKAIATGVRKAVERYFDRRVEK
jgi:N-acetylmuramoyl-L-alanine amidase